MIDLLGSLLSPIGVNEHQQPVRSRGTWQRKYEQRQRGAELSYTCELRSKDMHKEESNIVYTVCRCEQYGNI